MGEVASLAGDSLTLDLAGDGGTVLMRDACRDASGLLVTAPPAGAPAVSPGGRRSRGQPEREAQSVTVGGVNTSAAFPPCCARLAYATDLADTAANRRTVCSLARRADLLGCEAAFLSADADQAAATRHLTAAACVEIARDAGAERLLAFHFSRRYSRHPEAVGRELLQAARGTALEGKLVGLPSLVRR